MFELSVEMVLALMGAAFAAGLIDAIAGGGGLITVPALLLAGAGPVQALATNKLQGAFGAGAAALAYARAGHVDWRGMGGMVAMAALAGGLGAAVAHLVPAEVLRLIMPVILIAVALYFALRKGISDQDRRQRMALPLFTFTAIPLIAAYDGIFGPGTGSFFMMAFALLAGFSAIKATAHTKFVNVASNLGALVVFAPTGAVMWKVGLAMALAQTLGAAIGARLAMRVGARLIRPLLVVTSTGMALRLIWQAWSG